MTIAEYRNNEFLNEVEVILTAREVEEIDQGEYIKQIYLPTTKTGVLLNLKFTIDKTTEPRINWSELATDPADAL